MCKTMSKSTQIPVTDIILNEDNPRQMSEDKFPRLIESLLVFPKMLKTRPMVLDENGVVLGGNMRTDRKSVV